MKRYLICFLLLSSLGVVQGENISEDDSRGIGDNIYVARSESTTSLVGVDSKALDSPSIDVAESLYGKIAGLNIYQGTGTSANNIASLSLHGRVPLVIVDGAPRDLNDIVVADIESISVLKDAASYALYGVRGANGVVIVTTKQGNGERFNVNCNYQFGLSTQFRAPQFADSYTYANSLNSALAMDNLPERYNTMELEAFRDGKYTDHYADVDWWNETHNNLAYNHRLSLTFDGGSDKLRYYSVVDYMHDKAFLKSNDSDDRYNAKPTDTRLNLRTNLDVKLTNTTNMLVGVSAKLKEMNRANYGSIYSHIYNTPSAAYPIKYTNGVYGGSAIYDDNNPVALLMDSGNTSIMQTSVMTNVLLNQNLDEVVKGLSASAYASFDYAGSMSDATYKSYRYVDPNPTILDDDTMVAKPIYYGEDTETLSHSDSFVDLFIRSSFQGKVNYRKEISQHDVDATFMYEHNGFVAKDRNRSINRQSLILLGDYTYDDRYSVGVTANYSGSAYLPEGDRFNLFYGVSASWNVSNEKFMKDVKFINDLRIIASHGVSGWDGGLSHELHLESYDDSYAGGYYFTDNVSGQGGFGENRLPVENLTVEKMRKSSLGVNMSILDRRLNLYVEGYYDERFDILVPANTTVSGIVGVDVGPENSGKQDFWGVDFGVSWSDKKGAFKYGGYVNGGYMSSKLINSNQAYQQYAYLRHSGNMVGQSYGLEVDGFFNNQYDINNSPVQTFGDVSPGDIKYVDQNGDNKIDDNDIVKMAGSNIPQFYFGFGVDLSYKKFGINADFQGMTGVTVNLLYSPLYKPLVSNGNISDTFLSSEQSWTVDNIDNATMPRLTTLSNNNNYRNNSLWYRDGSFLKLRSLKLTYTLPKMVLYLQGTNLFSLDNIKTVDPEQLGAVYPSERSYWVGVKLNF